MATTAKAFMHSCGGWYVAHEDEDGFHWQPAGCGGCHATRALAAAAVAAAEDDVDE